MNLISKNIEQASFKSFESAIWNGVFLSKVVQNVNVVNK